MIKVLWSLANRKTVLIPSLYDSGLSYMKASDRLSPDLIDTGVEVVAGV